MRRRTALAAMIATASFAFLPPTAVAGPPDEVDESRLVPALNPDFAPWDCKLKNTGPVCTGAWHLEEGWVATDWPCHEQIHVAFETHRYSTRFYDHDYLNYDRKVRYINIDRLGTTSGVTTATITSRGRFFEPFAVPGDAGTFTIVTVGTILEIRPTGGAADLRIFGTLVEPPGEVPTFTGHATIDGATTRYEDAPLEDVLSEEEFLAHGCRAAAGG